MKDEKMISKLFDLEGRNIVITGASGLLGSQYANILSSAGANIILLDIDTAKNEKLKSALVKKYKNVVSHNLACLVWEWFPDAVRVFCTY